MNIKPALLYNHYSKSPRARGALSAVNLSCDNNAHSFKLNQLANLNSSMVNFRGIQEMTNVKDDEKYKKFEGCLVGGAIGDAFGAPVEAWNIKRIEKLYGETGIRYIPKAKGLYRVTDDTQMTLFTMEGLVRSYLKTQSTTTEPDYKTIYNSYQNWYKTQTQGFETTTKRNGLLNDPSLYIKRGPGKTCLDSLGEGVMGSVEEPVNNSCTNGGVMKTAPIGLMYHKDPKLAFRVGVNCAALTHGHPDAYLPAGFQSALIANLINGLELDDAIDESLDILQDYDNHESTYACVQTARALADSDIDSKAAIEIMGKGYVGTQALSIALYCVLKNPDNFKKAILMGVNHDGDSDTVGAIVGNIMGAYLGSDKIPRGLLENVEHLPWLVNYAKSFTEITNSKQTQTNNEDIVPIYTRWDDDRLG